MDTGTDAARPNETANLADRLARLIRVPTVSLGADRDEAAFDQFRALLREMYPLTHQRLHHRLVVGGSLLFHWPGRGGPTRAR